VLRGRELAPTGDEERFDRVELLPKGGDAGRDIPARVAGRTLDVRAHELAETDARGPAAAELAERRPGFVVDGDAGDARAGCLLLDTIDSPSVGGSYG
jgi:hypothetical protein